MDFTEVNKEHKATVEAIQGLLVGKPLWFCRSVLRGMLYETESQAAEEEYVKKALEEDPAVM